MSEEQVAIELDEFIDEWSKRSNRVENVNFYLANIHEGLRTAEAQCAYLEGNEEVDVTKIRSILYTLYDELNTIATEARDEEEYRNASKDKDKLKKQFENAKRLAQSQDLKQQDKAYRVLHRIAGSSKGTELSNNAIREARKLYDLRLISNRMNKE